MNITAMARLRLLCSILGLLGMLLLWPHTGISCHAQGPDGAWSKPVLIYENPDGGIRAPVLAIDRTGAVHVFWYVSTAANKPGGGLQSIYYTRLQGDRWTPPTDILLSPGATSANTPKAVADEFGQLHVLWTGGRLYYSRARADRAESPLAWSAPVEVGEGKNVLPTVGLVLVPPASLHAVFAESGGEVYYIASEDLGKTWSAPKQVSFRLTQNVFVGYPLLDVDDSGRLYVVWTEYQAPEGYPPTGAYFAFSTDGGNTWSAPLELVGANHGEANIAVARDGGVLHVVYHGRAGVGGTYHRLSRDGGLSWSPPHQLLEPGHGGLTGYPGLAIDSIGQLHLIVGEAVGWYGVWRPQGWSPLTDITSAAAETVSFVEEPTIAVGHGNRLHVVFYDGELRLWYTTRTLPIPGVPYSSFPAMPREPDAQRATSPSPTPASASSQPPQVRGFEGSVSIQGPARTMKGETAVLVGILPALALVAVTLWVSVLRRSR